LFKINNETDTQKLDQFVKIVGELMSNIRFVDKTMEEEKMEN